MPDCDAKAERHAVARFTHRKWHKFDKRTLYCALSEIASFQTSCRRCGFQPHRYFNSCRSDLQVATCWCCVSPIRNHYCWEKSAILANTRYRTCLNSRQSGLVNAFLLRKKPSFQEKTGSLSHSLSARLMVSRHRTSSKMNYQTGS